MNLNASDRDISAFWLIKSFISKTYSRIFKKLALIEIFESKVWCFFVFGNSQYQIFIDPQDGQETWVCSFLARSCFLFILMTNRNQWLNIFLKEKNIQDIYCIYSEQKLAQ